MLDRHFPPVGSLPRSGDGDRYSHRISLYSFELEQLQYYPESELPKSDPVTSESKIQGKSDSGSLSASLSVLLHWLAVGVTEIN